MAIEIDARGLSCPQPVLLFLEAAKKNPEGAFDVLVDVDVSRENVSRAAENRGFAIDVAEEDGGWRLKIRKA